MTNQPAGDPITIRKHRPRRGVKARQPSFWRSRRTVGAQWDSGSCTYQFFSRLAEAGGASQSAALGAMNQRI